MAHNSHYIVKKVLLLLMLLAFTSVSIFAETRTGIIGDVKDSWGDEIIPICNYWKNSYIGSECLYRKNELNSINLKKGDIIKCISFYHMYNMYWNASGGKFHIRMKNTNITSFKNNDNTFDTSCIEVSYDDQVNSNSDHGSLSYGAGDWENFYLTTPFVYNGQNIIIDIRNTAKADRQIGCYFATTQYQGTRRSLAWYCAKSENVTADGFVQDAYSTYGGIWEYNGTSYLPVIKITYETKDDYLATGISLNKTSLTLKVGRSETLIATVTPDNATNKNVTWSSSNNEVATVDNNGNVIAKSVGTATITATTTDGTNLEAECIVTVIPKGECPPSELMFWTMDEQPLDDVTIWLMLMNSSENLNGFNLLIKKDEGSEAIQWKKIGRTYFSAKGYANVILAQLEDATDEERDEMLHYYCNVFSNVKNDELVIVEILNTNACRFFPVLDYPDAIGEFHLDMTACPDGIYTIYAPDTPTGCSFSYTGGPEGTVSWTAYKPVVLNLTVVGDKVIAHTNEVLATGVLLNKDSLSLEVGATETLVATVMPDYATNKNVTWLSSNNNVATVDNNGKVTAKKPSTVTITATTTDGTNLSATCKVTVTPASPQDPCPSALMFSALKESQSSSDIAVELMLVNSSLNLNGFNIEVERASGSESIRFKNFTASNYANVILQRWEGTAWIENEDGDMEEVEITDAVRKQNLSQMCDIMYNEKTRSDGKKVFVILEVLSSNDCRFFPALDAPAAVGRMNLDMSSCADGTYKIVAPPTPAGCSFSYTGGPEGTRGWTADAPVEFSLMKVGDNVYAPVLGICTVDVDRNLVTTKYYNLQGIESDTPFPGINIKVTTYSDGTKSAKKILYKQ